MTHSLMYVFFFKQKTASEMRISDWSSDVCSSDLGTSPTACTGRPPLIAGRNVQFCSTYLRAALSSTRWPLLCSTSTCSGRPSTSTSTCSITVPCRPARRAARGYGGEGASARSEGRRVGTEGGGAGGFWGVGEH